ncbi:hypothetical protein [Parabacteroides hominis]|uniref:DUF2187 domain-containing protein n=1 Tax=Parabacteroides hominis TaxID=2763057 RepID=A0ABR7DT41_9BACT|nr:hypothetical protein [Parabacteroides hominis]MBC5634635.1 hypothetical protein [Parabacteroides hominis]
MKDNKEINKGDKVYIESMYGSPYHGVVERMDSYGDVVVKRDNKEYSNLYNRKRLTKDEE